MGEGYVGRAKVCPTDDPSLVDVNVDIDIDDVGSAAWLGSVMQWPAGNFAEGDALVVLLDEPREGHSARGRIEAKSPTSLTILGFKAFG
jgi:hypothetical protein